MLGLLAALLGHVPVYTGNAEEGKCVSLTDHETSQAVYVKARPGTTSGLEVADPPTTGFIDFDAVFRERYDSSTFALYVGCMSCDADDPVTAAPIPVLYSAAKLEPFAQTRYYGLNGVDKKYPAADLTASACAGTRSFGVRLESYANASVIYWSAVVGLEERFTAEQLLLFPSNILSSHGSEWTQLGWTLPVIAVLVPLIDIVSALVLWCRGAERWVAPSIVVGPHTPRAAILQLSAWAWCVPTPAPMDSNPRSFAQKSTHAGSSPRRRSSRTSSSRRLGQNSTTPFLSG